MAFRPDEVLFSPTTRCNLNCPHCGIARSEETLSKKLACDFLIGCKSIGINRIGFTGGEPFLAPDFLWAVSRAAVREGFLFDRIMTNGVWYRNKDDLRKALTRLYKCGYDGAICVSVDAFHDQDVRKVAHFIETAASIWQRPDVISIASVMGARDDATKRMIGRLSALLNGRNSGLDYIKSKSLFIKILKIRLSSAGGAETLNSPRDGKWFKEDYCRGPGNVFFVEPSGDVKPCCGYANAAKELTVGNIKRDSAAAIMKNIGRNRLVYDIFNSGLARIRKRLESLGVVFAGRTSDHCYFCQYVLASVPREILGKSLKGV